MGHVYFPRCILLANRIGVEFSPEIGATRDEFCWIICYRMNTHGLFNDPTGIRVHMNGAIIGKLSCLYHNELLQIIPFDALALHFLGNIMG